MDINDIHLFQSTAKILPVPFHGRVKENTSVLSHSRHGSAAVVASSTNALK